MKLMMRQWPWLVTVSAAGLVCATYLLAQTQPPTSTATQVPQKVTLKVTAPNATEAADCAQLIAAVNAGDEETALEILHNYGMADDTVLEMAKHLGKPPAHVELKEPFLKASVGALALTDRILRTNVQTRFSTATVSLGYERPVWRPRRPNTWAIASFDTVLLDCPEAPILVLNERLDDPCFIRYFKLYSRYADYLHSVVLNGPNLSNPKFDVTNYDAANRELNALFQLIKARNPDAFVWLGVVKEDSRSDEQWLKAMFFRPDGLQISNLRQFNSPFAQTRQRYLKILGADMPMMVSGFYGYKAALRSNEKMLAAALKTGSASSAAAATAQLGGVGVAVGSNLAELENQLQSLGYRGLSAHWLLLAAMGNANQAAPIDQSNLLDPRAGLLDTYYENKDFDSLTALASDLVAESTAGSMDWTVGKLYEGIAWLSQDPPRTNDAINVLNDILSFDFKNNPGRDHYILGAVKWRIYAASLSGDKPAARELARWVENSKFRKDLKASFLKRYRRLLPSKTTTSK